MKWPAVTTVISNYGVFAGKVPIVKEFPAAFSVALVMLILIGCNTSHDHESFYAALANAKQAGEVQRGWIPTFLPESSTTIHIAYDLSPSRVWCAFQFDPGDAGNLRNNLNPVEQFVPPPWGVRSPAVPWWPKLLEGSLNTQKVQGAGLKLYTVSRRLSEAQTETLLFAMDWPKGQGYFTDALQ